jgi:hypothetical protein
MSKPKNNKLVTYKIAEPIRISEDTRQVTCPGIVSDPTTKKIIGPCEKLVWLNKVKKDGPNKDKTFVSCSNVDENKQPILDDPGCGYFGWAEQEFVDGVPHIVGWREYEWYNKFKRPRATTSSVVPDTPIQVKRQRIDNDNTVSTTTTTVNSSVAHVNPNMEMEKELEFIRDKYCELEGEMFKIKVERDCLLVENNELRCDLSKAMNKSPSIFSGSSIMPSGGVYAFDSSSATYSDVTHSIQ